MSEQVVTMVDKAEYEKLVARLAELTRANADLRESLAASEATVARLVGERDKAEKLNEFFCESVGECHMLISRNATEYQCDRQDWESTSLPPRVRELMRTICELRERRDFLLTSNNRLVEERRAAEALAKSRRLALGEVYEAAEQWHYSVEWEGQEHTGKVMAICTAAMVATGSTALDKLKRDVRVETLDILVNQFQRADQRMRPEIGQVTWMTLWESLAMMRDAAAIGEWPKIAAGTEVEDGKEN